MAALLLGAACSLFKARVVPYPQGVSFPLAEESSFVFPGMIVPPVQHKGGVLYFAVRKGGVLAMDVFRGRISWEFKTDNPVRKNIVAAADRLYVLDEGNVLYILDMKGLLLSRTPLAGKITSGIATDGTRIYLGAEDGSLLALDPLDPGEAVWHARAGGAIRENPVFWNSGLAFGSDDRKIYFYDFKGKALGTAEFSGKIQGPALASAESLYFGTDDRWFRRVAWGTGKEKWKIKLGGVVAAIREAGGRRLILLGSNGVLYCLDARGGDILWWRNVPSREFFNLEMSDGKVLVASLSNRLPAFDLKTGNSIGEYLGEREFVSNALWLEPYVVQSVYDFSSDTGKIVLLKKDLQAVLVPSLPSPQPVGQEILFQAAGVGFHLPRFEFYVRDGEKTDIQQKKSEKQSWSWYPDKEGTFTVGVRVSDEKEAKEAELTFVIQKAAGNPQETALNERSHGYAEG